MIIMELRSFSKNFDNMIEVLKIEVENKLTFIFFSQKSPSNSGGEIYDVFHLRVSIIEYTLTLS